MSGDCENGRPKRVLVVGAGAAGMACADTLAQHPDRFHVTVVEAQSNCGGQMFSIPIDQKEFGASWLNQGVQGGSHIYHHTFYVFEKLNHHPRPVDLQVSFGKGNTFWTNVYPTQLVARHSKEIERFSWVIKVMRWLELIFAMIPIKVSLKMFFFSDEFINSMIYPSLALFLGTGNATPNLPTVMMERLYTSPTYGMWYPIDRKMLTSNLPPMVVFPEATAVYTDWQHSLEKKGVSIRLNTQVKEVISRSKKDGVRVSIIRKLESNSSFPSEEGAKQPYPLKEELLEETYDEIVFCVLADTAKKLLGNQARWIEKKVLGETKWSDDVTVTHNDLDYMKRWYELEYNKEVAVSDLGGRDESGRVEKAKQLFQPHRYHTRFAGSWTLVNAHEVAVISGIAAAYSLGADYPKELKEDQFARLCFRLYLLLVHWRWFSG
ncbi:hypothetical protein HHX47_DHR10000133 [Lentinula edodes]|nr:hypothetical protein HHX47_DHR10000133 [Lentinula edodes]